MSSRVTVAVSLILGVSWCLTVHADTWKPTEKVSFEKATQSPPPASSPVVTILSPANLDMEKTQPKDFKDDGMTVKAQCVIAGDISIKVKAENWKVAPRGNGVAVVIDNRWGVVLHDLSKPIKMSALLPRLTPDMLEQQMQTVSGACGWHFVAAFATFPNGESVKADGALAVSYFHLGPGGDDMADIQRKAVMILNTPMLGANVEHDNKHKDGAGFAGGDTAAVDFLFWNLKQPLVGSNFSIIVFLDGDSLGPIRESYGPYLIKHLSKGLHEGLAITWQQAQTDFNKGDYQVPYYNER